MKKWLCILVLTLCMGFACAEEEIFYTNNEDRYYHSNPDCDRPEIVDTWGMLREFYPREVWEKYEISEAAAAEFEKSACPLCVNGFEPFYLGEHLPQWTWEMQPWEIVTDVELQAEIRKALPQAYRDECADTHTKFEEFYAEVYDRETDSFVRRHSYPEVFAGNYMNISGTATYAVTGFDAQTREAFERLFGEGAWIVPAKYGWNEMYAEQNRIFAALGKWCAAHPETGVQASSAYIDVVENKLIVGVSGANWRQAAAALDGDAPPYVCFAYEELSFAAAEGK